MGEQVSESYICVGLNGRVFLPLSGILSVLCVPPQRTLRLIASHWAKPLLLFLYALVGVASAAYDRHPVNGRIGDLG